MWCDLSEKELLTFLRDSINLNNKKWKHRFTTNCYAFSLGLDVREHNIMTCAYIPGNIGNSNEKIQFTHCFTYQNLINNLYDDLLFMRIHFREINPLDIVDEDEWKIALLTTCLAYEDYIEYLEDFHFLRAGSDGIWYHKPGWYRGISNKDSNKKVITDPRKCYIKNMDYKMSLALKMR